MDDIQRDPANFVAMFIGNENGVVPVLQLWAFLEQPLGECRRGVHCRNVVRQFHSTFIANRIGIDKVEVIEGHYFSRRTLLDLLPAGAFFQSMKLPLVLSLLVQVCCPGRWSVAPFAFRPTAPLRALSPMDLLAAILASSADDHPEQSNIIGSVPYVIDLRSVARIRQAWSFNSSSL